MHILFFINSLAGGGAERVTANLANHWAKKGWRVTILTLTDDDKDAYSLHPNVRRQSLKLAEDSPTPIAAARNNLRRILALRRVLRAEKPDVSLGIMSTASCLLALTGRPTTGLLIGTERSHPPMGHLGRMWEVIRKYNYRRLDAVVALTSDSASWINAHTSARAVSVIPNPAVFPLPREVPLISPELIVDPAGKVLLAVGRLSAEKGFDRLLHAFAHLAPAFPDWQLVILGEGPSRHGLVTLADDLGITDRVRLPGRAGNPGDWYAKADAFVLTSLFEGFPNALVEALSYGLPAVSVDCSTGPRDIIRNGVDGLLVEQNNPDALHDALKRVMENDELRAALSSEAISIRDRLSLATIAKQWETLFQELRG